MKKLRERVGVRSRLQDFIISYITDICKLVDKNGITIVAQIAREKG